MNIENRKDEKFKKENGNKMKKCAKIRRLLEQEFFQNRQIATIITRCRKYHRSSAFYLFIHALY
jgi:hypothetical protein